MANWVAMQTAGRSYIAKTALLVGAVCLLVAASSSWSLAWAKIYSYEDERGVLVLTDTFPQGRTGVKVMSNSTQKETMTRAQRRDQWDRYILSTANRYEVEPALIKAIIRAESNFDPLAVSPKGAEGLMQLMPPTAAMLNVVNSFDPVANIEGGVRYFKHLLDKFQGELELSLAAYNAGPAAVERHSGIPPFRETREYVSRVLSFYETYRLHPF